ncbi:MAG: hypothetical protein IJ748_07825 [Bacteroidales bacterium]|nr:hypothetical protein [Bacteroidales bacterium]
MFSDDTLSSIEMAEILGGEDVNYCTNTGNCSNCSCTNTRCSNTCQNEKGCANTKQCVLNKECVNSANCDCTAEPTNTGFSCVQH